MMNSIFQSVLLTLYLGILYIHDFCLFQILLRIFAEYAEADHEKLYLLFLSSQEGSDYFSDLIRKPSLLILDILSHFKSCKPPVEKIIGMFNNYLLCPWVCVL